VLKLIKYSFIYLAASIMLLHNFIPHTHEGELSSAQHQEIHKTENLSAIDVLALIFHEFTEEGEMEDILLRSNANEILAATFILLPTILNSYDFLIDAEYEIFQHPVPKDELHQSVGYFSALSVRPPPSA
jgi:hypothetical protein